jgi:hypothetical protein
VRDITLGVIVLHIASISFYNHNVTYRIVNNHTSIISRRQSLSMLQRKVSTDSKKDNIALPGRLEVKEFDRHGSSRRLLDGTSRSGTAKDAKLADGKVARFEALTNLLANGASGAHNSNCITGSGHI